MLLSISGMIQQHLIKRKLFEKRLDGYLIIYAVLHFCLGSLMDAKLLEIKDLRWFNLLTNGTFLQVYGAL